MLSVRKTSASNAHKKEGRARKKAAFFELKAPTKVAGCALSRQKLAVSFFAAVGHRTAANAVTFTFFSLLSQQNRMTDNDDTPGRRHRASERFANGVSIFAKFRAWRPHAASRGNAWMVLKSENASQRKKEAFRKVPGLFSDLSHLPDSQRTKYLSHSRCRSTCKRQGDLVGKMRRIKFTSRAGESASARFYDSLNAGRK